MSTAPPSPAASGGDLDALLAARRDDIAALRAAAAAEAPLPALVDEIFLLRYVLSFPTPDARADALRKCLAWRAANAALLADAAAGRPPAAAAAVGRFSVAGFHGATRDGDPLFIVRSALCDPVALMNACSEEDVMSTLMHAREVGFLLCDAETRARRRLVKQVTLVNLEGSPIGAFDRRYFATLGESSNISEFAYPQLLRRTVIFHPPYFFSAVYAVIKPFMSAKSIEKTVVCPGRAPAGGPAGALACPAARALFDAPALPTFLGGACRCTAAGGCVGERPNEETRPAPAGGPRGARVAVPARAAHDVKLVARAAGAALAYAFDIEAQGLEVSAWVTPDAGADVPLVAAEKHKAGAPVAARVVVPVAGTVTLRFSNAHSMLTGKVVTVTASVEAAAAAM